MAREKKPVRIVLITNCKHNIIQQLLEEYDIESAVDILEAFKDVQLKK